MNIFNVTLLNCPPLAERDKYLYQVPTVIWDSSLCEMVIACKKSHMAEEFSNFIVMNNIKRKVMTPDFFDFSC